MIAVKAILAWLFRQALVLCLIMAAIAIYQNDKVRTAIVNELSSPGAANAALNRLRKQYIDRLEASKTDILSKNGKALENELKNKQRDFDQIQRAIESNGHFPNNIRPSSIIKNEERKLRRLYLSSEISLLKAVTKKEALRTALGNISYPSQITVNSARKMCDEANEEAVAFNRLNSFEKNIRNWISKGADELSFAVKEQCGQYRAKKIDRETGLKKGEAARQKLKKATSHLSRAERDVTQKLKSYSPDVGIKTIQTLLKQALLILAGIIAMPFIIRTVFYYVLAPLAERRSNIRIAAPDSSGTAIPSAEHSRISISITLQRDDELLVRQNYLQTISLVGKKDTRWLLDYRHMLSSIASGLTFLTRIRGEGETTTVSAVQDAFAELGEITLPKGSACVLHPRALVALVQPVGQTMRITSHWRLFSLNAWLTFQLRYLVFHGPVKLVVKGGRGIRVERAESGRIFGQDQLVGFSTDIAYSIIRTETFAPYFFGREQLFKDKVEQGSGILIIEEAPFSSRRGRGVRGGLEGMLDAGMKAFGL